jgi:hypothetical protein
MSARVFFSLLAVIASAAFLVGRYAWAPADDVAAPPPATAAVTPTRVPPPAGDLAAPPAAPDLGERTSTEARYPLPPVPNDPGLKGWLASGSPDPTPDMLAGKDKDISARLDQLFGADFPAEKRAKVLAAQDAAMRRSAQFSWDYYHGNISPDEYASQLHQAVLTYAHDIEGALDRDEYREFMGVEVGEDPYTAITTPGLKPGDPVPP